MTIFGLYILINMVPLKCIVSRFNCFTLFGIHFSKNLFVFAINRQKYCKIGLVCFVGGPKKRREYVPREIWISSQSGVKKVPKRKILPVNRPETQKYSISPRKGMFSVDSLPVPQEWLNSPQLQGLIQTVVDNRPRQKIICPDDLIGDLSK